MQWRMRGRCWKFGDDILNDGGISSLELVRAGIFDPDRVNKLVRKARLGQTIGVKDNMAVVGVLSTQLFVDHFMEKT